MPKLTREDIILEIHNQTHPPKPRKVDDFGRVLEWEDESKPENLDEAEPEGQELDERFKATVCLPKKNPQDRTAELAGWSDMAAEIVKNAPPGLRKAAEAFKKAVDFEFAHSDIWDDKKDGEGNLDEGGDVDPELLDEAKKGKLKKSLKLKNGDEIPAGTTVEVEFDRDEPERALLKMDFKTDNRDYKEEPVKMSAGKLYLYVGGFGKPPSINTMMKWSDDGVAQTVTGKRVEPDGVGPDGSPSWLLVLGYI